MSLNPEEKLQKIRHLTRPNQRTLLPTIEGSTTIDPWNPKFQLQGTMTEVLNGDVMEKVGRRTGWTAGQVTNPCRTFSLQELSGWFSWPCTAVVSAGVGKGDSGSPVFWESTSTPGTYYLAGILFAGLVNVGTGLGAEYYFSTWDYVEFDLGGPSNDLQVVPPTDPPCGGEIAC